MRYRGVLGEDLRAEFFLEEVVAAQWLDGWVNFGTRRRAECTVCACVL
jgi:hypothetical protein